LYYNTRSFFIVESRGFGSAEIPILEVVWVYLADQLQRAGTSVPLNIAEGAGEYACNEKIRFYRMARHSATECAGILDVCLHLKLIEEERYKKGRELLMRIVAMLIKMSQGTG